VTATFYDKAMTAPGAPSMLPLEQSPWLPVYEEAARWIGNDPVIDLGCGTGRFAQALYSQTRRAPYLGIDFSRRALAEAKRGFSEGVRKYEGITFSKQDLTRWKPEIALAASTTFTCLEVLEHFEGDLDLVGRIPPGFRLIFSVPNYPSEAHVRDFRTVGAIWERYGSLVTFTRWSLIDLDGAHAIHLLDCKRRIESW
jgi:trans-aconitate methyltransferase